MTIRLPKLTKLDTLIFLSLLPEKLRLQACATVPDLHYAFQAGFQLGILLS
jgi:hypothetical protein